MRTATAAEPRRPGASPAWWLLALAPTAVLAVLLGMSATGASTPTLVADPGAFVRWGLPVVETLIRLSQAVCLGGLVLLLVVLPPPKTMTSDAGPGSARRPAWQVARTAVAVAGPVWALLSLLSLVLGYAMIAGRPLGGPGFGDELGYFLTEISAGRAGLVTAVLVAVTALASVAVGGYGSAALALLLAVATVIPEASAGHAAGASNHDLAMTAQFGHILGTAVWVGAMAVLVLAHRSLTNDGGSSAVADAASRYSAIALWCFAVVGVSGAAAAAIRLGSVGALASGYGAVVLAKVAALAALGVAGWWHRERTIAAIRAGAAQAFWRLLGVELAILAIAAGLGIALSASAPPVPQEAGEALTPTELISARPAPPEPTADAVLSAFYPDLLFGSVAVAMLGVYVGWVLRLRRRGDRWPLSRTLAWVAAWLLFGYLVLGAPAVYGHVLLSVHMAAHMAYAMIVPILLVLSAPVTLALRALPGRADGSRGPREWLLTVVHSRVGSTLASPMVAAALFVGSMVAFYFTPLLFLAASTHLGHVLMIVHFTLTGYLFVNSLIGLDPGPARPGYPMRLLLLFATMAAHAFFGVAVMSSTELLAADYYGQLGLPWGVDALADQRNAGEIAWGLGEIPSIGIAVLLAVRWYRDDRRVSRRSDRAADRDGDAELTEYNAMLARLSEREVPGAEFGNEPGRPRAPQP